MSGNVQIWVAAGVYYPTTTTNRSISFQISRANLTVSGGFAGTETNFSQRNFVTNEVVLTGNIGSNATHVDNSLNVVSVTNANNTTHLMGLIIADGNNTLSGGGMIVSSGFLNISDCKFRYNNSSVHGGGLLLGGLQGASNQNVITRCEFIGNYASQYGGGVMISVGRSGKFTNCLFSRNSGIEAGGAIMVGNANADISNCTFSKNHSSTLTGIQYYRGSAICFLGTNSNNAVHNLKNSIIVENTPFNNIQVARPNNYGSYSNNLFEGVGYGANVLTFNPSLNLFADAESDDYRIDKFCSQAYNAGTTVDGTNNLDLENKPRIAYGKADLGAYEYAFIGNTTIEGIITCAGLSTGAVRLPNAGLFTAYYLDPNPSNGWDDQNSIPFYNGLEAGKYYTAVLQDGCPNITPLDSVTIADAPVLSFTGSVKQVNCNAAANAQIQVLSIVGGFGTATRAVRINFGGAFSAPRTFSGINVGVVTVTLSQLTCSKNYLYTITQPSALNAGVFGWSDVQCNGQNNGTVNFSPSGGVKPYSFSILGVGVSPYTVVGGDLEIGNLNAGTKQLTMRDANGCTVNSMNFTINQPPAIVANVIDKKNVSCFGSPTGFIVASATGGNQNSYIYSISNPSNDVLVTSNTISGLSNGVYNLIVSDLYYCKTTILGITITAPSALNLILSSTNNLCSGLNQGSITLSGSGGVSPYQYRWDEGAYQASNIFSGLFQGFYTMSIKDAFDCTTTVTSSLIDPLPFNVISQEIAPTCNGDSDGKILATITGGTGIKSVTINGNTFGEIFSIVGLAPSTYQMRIKDQNQCEDFYNATIQQKENIVLLSSLSNIKCFNGSDGIILLSATGGNGNYQYKINNGALSSNSSFGNLSAGSYNGYVEDEKGCNTTILSLLTQPQEPLSAALVSKTDIKCFGDASGLIVLTATGGSGNYQYSIDQNAYSNTNTFSGLNAGLKAINVKDQNECTITLPSVNLVEPTKIIASTTIENVNSIRITASGGTGSLLYAMNEGAYQEQNLFSNLISGNYTFKIADDNQCVTTVQQNLLITSLSNEKQTNLVSIFPNPSSGEVNIKSSKPAIIEIYNTGGELINSFVADSNLKKIVLQTKGLYIFKFITESETAFHKLVVE